MDWDRAIERNSLALMRIVSALFALIVPARVAGGGFMVPRHVWHAISIVLRPAEAAVRRLIIIAARALVHGSYKFRRRAANASPTSVQRPANAFPVAPVFQLFDPLKQFRFGDDDGGEGGGGYSGSETPDDTPLNAEPLFTRMRALRRALADLDAQARRLARHNARRDAMPHGRPVRMSLMRPGLPPGWHQRPKHEVDTVLRECHALVRYLENPPNTS